MKVGKKVILINILHFAIVQQRVGIEKIQGA